MSGDGVGNGEGESVEPQLTPGEKAYGQFATLFEGMPVVAQDTREKERLFPTKEQVLSDGAKIKVDKSAHYDTYEINIYNPEGNRVALVSLDKKGLSGIHLNIGIMLDEYGLGGADMQVATHQRKSDDPRFANKAEQVVGWIQDMATESRLISPATLLSLGSHPLPGPRAGGY